MRAVEAVEAGRSLTFGDPDEALLGLLRAGRKIEAIRVCRHQSGRGLSEAKQYVEELGRKHGVRTGGSGCGTALLAGLLLIALGLLSW
jgi:ribosomal protein L7/L12